MSTGCCVTEPSSTCIRSCGARCASVRARTRSRSSSRCTWATRCARAMCRRATTRSSATSKRARCATTGRMPKPKRSSTTSRTTTATTASQPVGCATGSSITRDQRACGPRRMPSRARTCTSHRRVRSHWRRSRGTGPTSRPSQPACGWVPRRSTITRASPSRSGRRTSCGCASRSRSGKRRATSW